MKNLFLFSYKLQATAHAAYYMFGLPLLQHPPEQPGNPSPPERTDPPKPAEHPGNPAKPERTAPPKPPEHPGTPAQPERTDPPKPPEQPSQA